MREICCRKSKIPKRLLKEGVDSSCHNFGTEFCETCGMYFCYRHIDPKKHKCKRKEE